MNKWPIAGLIAGIAVFLWGGIFHMALPIETMVTKTLPDDAAVTAVLKARVPEAGFYFFPNEMDPAKLEERAKTTPRGIMIYTPAGVPFSMSSSLGVQFVLDIMAALILAWLLSMAMPGPGNTGRKVCFAATIGLVVVVAVVLPWWNWYGMPLGMVAANLVEQLVGFATAGFVLAKLVK